MVELQSDRTKLAKVFADMQFEANGAPAIDFRMVERAVFGADHCHFGEALCEQWKFPRSLAVACAHHHDPMSGPAESRQIAWLIHVAERLATEQGGFRIDFRDRGIPREAFESLGISEANLAAVRAQLGEKLAEAQATLAA